MKKLRVIVCIVLMVVCYLLFKKSTEKENTQRELFLKSEVHKIALNLTRVHKNG